MIMIMIQVSARYVKFEVVSWWGKSGGLQYFNVMKLGTNKHRISVKIMWVLGFYANEQ